MAIAAERAHQVRKGYTLEHDAQHTDGSIAKCAGLVALRRAAAVHQRSAWWKKRSTVVQSKYSTNRIRQLAIAGALIAAEIDRLSIANRKSEIENP